MRRVQQVVHLSQVYLSLVDVLSHLFQLPLILLVLLEYALHYLLCPFREVAETAWLDQSGWFPVIQNVGVFDVLGSECSGELGELHLDFLLGEPFVEELDVGGRETRGARGGQEVEQFLEEEVALLVLVQQDEEVDQVEVRPESQFLFGPLHLPFHLQHLHQLVQHVVYLGNPAALLRNHPSRRTRSIFHLLSVARQSEFLDLPRLILLQTTLESGLFLADRFVRHLVNHVVHVVVLVLSLVMGGCLMPLFSLGGLAGETHVGGHEGQESVPGDAPDLLATQSSQNGLYLLGVEVVFVFTEEGFQVFATHLLVVLTVHFREHPLQIPHLKLPLQLVDLDHVAHFTPEQVEHCQLHVLVVVLLRVPPLRHLAPQSRVVTRQDESQEVIVIEHPILICIVFVNELFYHLHLSAREGVEVEVVLLQEDVDVLDVDVLLVVGVEQTEDGVRFEFWERAEPVPFDLCLLLESAENEEKLLEGGNEGGVHGGRYNNIVWESTCGQSLHRSIKLIKMFNHSKNAHSFGSTPQDSTEKKAERKTLRVDTLKMEQQKSIIIEGIEVYFPFEAYDIQKEYMATVIRALERRENALLQSPTGTGKTLCLLCASLAWLKHQREQGHQTSTRIIYSSRTHTQIEQVVKELKNTIYRPVMAVLASRDFYCIKDQFSQYKGNILNIECNKAKLIRNHQDKHEGCRYYTNLQKEFEKLQIRNEEKTMDIEELKADGRAGGYCPFYFSQKNKNDADIAFMPYNYLLDSKINSVYRLQLENSVLIFDEAHNVEGVTEDASGFNMTLNDLVEAEKELESLIKKINFQGDEGVFLNSNVTNVEDILRTLKRVQGNFGRVHAQYHQSSLGMKSEPSNPSDGSSNVMEGDAVFAMVDQLTAAGDGMLQVNLQGGRDDITSLDARYCQLLSQAEEDMATMSKGHFQKYANFMMQVHSLLEVHRMGVKARKEDKLSWSDDSVNHYKLSISTRRNRDLDEKEVAMWCFSPSVQFANLMDQQVRSVLLTSGTLSPFDSFESELKIPFAHKLSNKHIVPASSIQAMVVKQGINKTNFDFSFRNRNDRNMLIDVGETLLKFIERIPHGVLVFFSSYSILDSCYKVWLDTQIIRRMEQVKQVVKEPKSARELDGFMRMFKQKATEGGAILLAVCRGKVAEGIDFSDELCRAVFMMGIPYAPMKDPKVVHKQRYLEAAKNRKAEKSTMSGQQWYQIQAIRSTNQAIGRVIRHLNDYGAIIFMDQRFSYQNNFNHISGWIKEVTQFHDEFGPAYRAVIAFFKQFQNQQKYIPFNFMQQRDEEAVKPTFARKPIQFTSSRNANAIVQDYLNKKDSDSDEGFKKIDVANYSQERMRIGDNSRSACDDKPETCCRDNMMNSYMDRKDQFRLKKPVNLLLESQKKGQSLLNFQPKVPESAQPKGQEECDDLGDDDCIVCLAKYQANEQFMKSKCGHVCCKSCWNRTLSYKFSCPMCRQKVRKTQLQFI